MTRSRDIADQQKNLGGAVAPFVAGKNAVINGAFDIWQRGTSISLSNGVTAYTADRWRVYTQFSAGTSSMSQQTFTAGTAPVAGYEGTYFGRITCGSTATYVDFSQKIEDVRTFAGQTATLSFWAKSSAAIVLTPYLVQEFGSGGSANVNTSGSNITLTTSWVRYSMTVSVPSVSGKTIGTGSSLSALLAYVSGTLNSATIDFWGVQLEVGQTSTPFSRNASSIQGELAACQRYYYLHASGTSKMIGNGAYYSAAEVDCMIQFPVTMRTAPTIDQTTGTDYYTFYRNGGSDGFNSFTVSYASTTGTNLFNASQVSGTAGQAGQIATNNASAYLAFSAEL